MFRTGSTLSRGSNVTARTSAATASTSQRRDDPACYPNGMSGSASKRPRPSYEEGKARDPEVQKMLDEADDGGWLRFLQLLKKSGPKHSSKPR